MTKREQLHRWLIEHNDWVYLRDVPLFNMTRETLSSALRALCDLGCADYRVVGLKQYKGKATPLPLKGPKPPKGLK
jgi:hypothetical protein